jgi:hypothetical protein
MQMKKFAELVLETLNQTTKKFMISSHLSFRLIIEVAEYDDDCTRIQYNQKTNFLLVLLFLLRLVTR